MPETVQKLFFDFHWDREKLWREASGIATERLAIDELRPHLELPIWPRFTGQTTFDLSPAEFLREQARYPHHVEQIQRADLSYALILMPNLSSSWVLLDGYHRLVKCIAQGISQVEVKRLQRSAIPKIRSDV